MEEIIKYHYEQIIELLKDKSLDNKEKELNTKMGSGRFGAGINKSGVYMAKTFGNKNMITTLGKAVVDLPMEGLHLNQEAILEAISQKLSRKMYNDKFHEHLSNLINHKGKGITEILSDSRLEENYFHKILTGEEAPEKEAILRLSFALELNTTEMLHLLARLGYSLKPNSIKEDFIIIYGIDNKLSMDETEQLINQCL